MKNGPRNEYELTYMMHDFRGLLGIVDMFGRAIRWFEGCSTAQIPAMCVVGAKTVSLGEE